MPDDRSRAFSARSLLLWLPTLAPLGVGTAALLFGLHQADWTVRTLAMLLGGVWGGALGVFIGSVLAGMALARALGRLGVHLVAGPLLTAVATAALATPLAVGARLIDGDAGRIPLIAFVCWYGAAAALGVELLDRVLRRTARPAPQVRHPWDP